MKYKIIQVVGYNFPPTAELEKKVNAATKDGWVPSGPVSHTIDGKGLHYMSQGMTKAA
jgi:Domain of unknown function (DUF1737)